MTQNYANLDKNTSSTKEKLNNYTKTTDVNILLNRVRLDKKKTFIKNISVSFLIVSLVCTITIFLII